MTHSRCPFRTLWLGLGLITTAGSLTGCGLLDPGAFPADGPERTASPTAGNVTREEFGDAGPLEVDSSDVACELNNDGDPVLGITTPDGTGYALDQLAERTLPRLEVIAVGSVGPLRSQAFAACDEE
ncbi:hypothetical protein [Leucobacter chromiireducens]|uniref:Superoxide dismutase n=1 Tax=Leucobacter chromiireducens subsp. solipictus TaxID=398235 RepID=A0ABS1SJT7_9MICO|nr:hypothetical protein [Leucobacter chromiireducens]MBL3680116.1 superoxide dismutase [Leucobacter chromiireducens subsp. solipictus]